MTEDEREAFLSETRLGMLTMLNEQGEPLAVPVWFEWNGSAVRMFSFKRAPKVRRLRANPRASLLVVNHIGKPEAWTAFDGDVAISDEGAMALADRLAPKYWDMHDASHAKELADWRKHASRFCLLTLTPERIRTS
jgi:PPOX class probable F420-dependent enzyme